MSEERKLLANIPPFGLRLQPELKRRVEDAARTNTRSLNSEIVARLEASFERSDRTSEVQGIMIESLSRENEALKKAGMATENLLFVLAGAVNRAASGDDTELRSLVEREKSDPTFSRIKTIWGAIRED